MGNARESPGHIGRIHDGTSHLATSFPASPDGC